MTSRTTIFAYGALCYLFFFGTFCYLAGFLGNLVVPNSIDAGPPGPLVPSLLVNLGLVALFGLQHSIMARPWFKRLVTRIVPAPAERSTYVLASCAVLVALFALWRPLPGVVWSLEGAGASVAWSLFALGWGIILYASTLIDHLDLFGLRQVLLHLRGRRYTEKSFAIPGLYRFVRHPLYVGWLLALWATPQLTVGHLVFAGANTVYILVAIVLEERDLVRTFGRDYLRYRATTPALVPIGRRSPRSAATTLAAR